MHQVPPEMSSQYRHTRDVLMTSSQVVRRPSCLLIEFLHRCIYAPLQVWTHWDNFAEEGKRATCPPAGPVQAPARRRRKASAVPVRTAATRPRPRSQAQSSQPTGVHPMAALLVSMRTLDTAQPPKPHLTSLQTYPKNIKATSTNPIEYIAALDDDLKIDAILDERTGPKGALLYKLRWQSTLLLKRHAPLLKSGGHGGTCSTVDSKLYGPRVSALY